MSTNGPPVTVVLPYDMVEFLIENSNANIVFGLSLINNKSASRDEVMRTVKVIENFKRLKEIIESTPGYVRVET